MIRSGCVGFEADVLVLVLALVLLCRVLLLMRAEDCGGGGWNDGGGCVSLAQAREAGEGGVSIS